MTTITISTLQQAANLIGGDAGTLTHDGEQQEIDIALLDDRRFTSCGITADGRSWIGVGHHPGPGIAPAVVVFLPFDIANDARPRGAGEGSFEASEAVMLKVARSRDSE
jgi:hypothetical protein